MGHTSLTIQVLRIFQPEKGSSCQEVKLSNIDKHGLSYWGQNDLENDLKGHENYFKLAGGSSYWGFVLLRVRLQ